MTVETGLHLNPNNPLYDRSAVEALISAAQTNISANIEGPASVRLVSTQIGEIMPTSQRAIAYSPKTENG
jgi:hypothetical protein